MSQVTDRQPVGFSRAAGVGGKRFGRVDRSSQWIDADQYPGAGFVVAGGFVGAGSEFDDPDAAAKRLVPACRRPAEQDGEPSPTSPPLQADRPLASRRRSSQSAPVPAQRRPAVRTPVSELEAGPGFEVRRPED